MTTENSSTKAVKLQILEELGECDFAHLKQSVQLLYTCAIPHEFFNYPETRARIHYDFKALYNFLLQMEMHQDPEMEMVNLLS